MSHKLDEAYSSQIQKFFGGGHCRLLSKGRVALYAGLAAMDLPPGRKIIIPGYTCVVVPGAAQYVGLEPVYVDIDPRTYNLDPAQLDQVWSDDVALLAVQHTYGIPCDMTAIEEWAKARGVKIVEDCCHTFGTRVDDRLCGTFGVFAFMSGQWNKPFSTGLGGMLLVNDDELASRVDDLIEREAAVPGFARNLLLWAQIQAYNWLVTPRSTGWITGFYRALSKRGLVIGSSSQEELTGDLPEGYFSKMAPCQIAKGLREITRIDQNLEHRRQLTKFYRQRLPERGYDVLPDIVDDETPLLRYPVRVANRTEVLARAQAAKQEIGSWFEAPLHAAEAPMENWGYREGMCPEAERACREVINLPTHMKMSETGARQALDFLSEVGRPVEA